MFLNNKKCGVCSTKLKKDKVNELRLNTVDAGDIAIEICDECADFFDKSADLLRAKKDE
jgi:hypothetical protein